MFHGFPQCVCGQRALWRTWFSLVCMIAFEGCFEIGSPSNFRIYFMGKMHNFKRIIIRFYVISLLNFLLYKITIEITTKKT